MRSLLHKKTAQHTKTAAAQFLKIRKNDSKNRLLRSRFSVISFHCEKPLLSVPSRLFPATAGCCSTFNWYTQTILFRNRFRFLLSFNGSIPCREASAEWFDTPHPRQLALSVRQSRRFFPVFFVSLLLRQRLFPTAAFCKTLFIICIRPPFVNFDIACAFCSFPKR